MQGQIQIKNRSIIDEPTDDQTLAIAKVISLIQLGNKLTVSMNGKDMLLTLVDVPPAQPENT